MSKYLLLTASLVATVLITSIASAQSVTREECSGISSSMPAALSGLHSLKEAAAKMIPFWNPLIAKTSGQFRVTIESAKQANQEFIAGLSNFVASLEELNSQLQLCAGLTAGPIERVDTPKLDQPLQSTTSAQPISKEDCRDIAKPLRETLPSLQVLQNFVDNPFLDQFIPKTSGQLRATAESANQARQEFAPTMRKYRVSLAALDSQVQLCPIGEVNTPKVSQPDEHALGSWLIPLVIGALVVGAAFVAASRLSLKVKQGGDIGVPSTKETASQESDIKLSAKRVSDIGRGANLVKWKPGVKILVTMGSAAILLVLAGFAWLLMRPGDLDCASEETQKIVFQTARERWTAVAERIRDGLHADERADVIKSIERSSKCLQDIRAVGALAECVLERKEILRELKYSLDTIRLTDKNLAGVLTCAATLKGDAGKYGANAQSITYKVEKTSDGRLYVGVYGLCSKNLSESDCLME